MTRLTGGPRVAIPPPGAVALAYGNSISDLSAFLGQWFTGLCNRHGWVRANSNLLGDGNFEDDNYFTKYNLQWTTPVGTLTVDTSRAKFGVRSARLAPTSGSAAIPYTSPFNAEIGDPHGDINCPMTTNALQSGTTYVFSVWVYLPTGTTAAPYLTFYDRILGDPPVTYQTTTGTSASLTILDAWQQITAVRPLRPGLAEAFVRVIYPEASGDATKGIWLDGAMLEVASGTDPTHPQPTAGYSANATRAAIGGSLLQDIVIGTDHANNETNGVIESRFALRVAAVQPDIVFVMYSTNDLYLWQQVAPPMQQKTTI